MIIYIYVLKDPLTFEIRYVGKTNNLKSRLNDHCSTKKDTNNHKRNWINSLKKKNLKPIIESIKEVDENNWKKWEKYYIKKYILEGFKLLNYTEGGDGLTFGNRTSFKGENSKNVVLLTKEGKYVDTFKSLTKAEEYTGKKGIDSVLCGKTKTCGGFICLYESEYKNLNENDLKTIVEKSKSNNSLNGEKTRFKSGQSPWNLNIKWKKTKHKKVYQYNKKTKEFIKEWNSTEEASNELKINQESIGKSCRLGKNGGGFLWSYNKFS